MSRDALRIGLLGVAHTAHAVSYGRRLLKAEGVTVTGVYDEDPVVAAVVADKLGGLPVFASQEDLLSQGRLDAAVVCGATDRHVSAVEAAAGAGLHVLCEKPIATTLYDADRMIRACEDAGVQLHMAFVCRFYPMVQAARQAVRDGSIGRVVGLVGGNRGRPPLPPHYPGWITDPARSGGGALIDHSVHVTDAIRHVTGAEVARVSAEVASLFQADPTLDDAVAMLLTLDDGSVASVDPSWSVAASSPYHYDFYLRILGVDGSIEIDDRRQALVVSSDRATPGSRTTVLEPFGGDLDERMLGHFLTCVRQGTFLEPAASGTDGLRALAVALAAYEAADRGTAVPVSGDGERAAAP